MKFNKKIIFTLTILFFLSISIVSAENSDYQTSILELDDNISMESILAPSHFSELQNQINAAQSKDTISLENDYEYDNGFDKNGIILDKQITINGNGKTIDGEGTSRIFRITADNVVIKNLILVNGFDKKTAGAIICTGSNLMIENCTFTNNNAAGTDGGALSILGNECKITNCQFTKNTAKKSGGAFLIVGNNTIIKDNVFTSNKAVDMLGGAFFIYGNSSIISNNNFTSNLANFSGGAIRVEGNNGQFYKNNFIKNHATLFLGGGACILGDKNTVDSNNFTNNFAGRDGGGLNMEGSIVEENGIKNIIKNNFFTRNEVLQYGAGIGTDCQHITIFNNTLIKNYSHKLGGAIRISGALTETGNIERNIIIDNYAGISGGAIYIMGNGTVISDNEIINNTAATVTGGAITIHGNDSVISNNLIESTRVGGSGGAIFWEGNNAKLTGNIIKNCKSESSAGAVHIEGSYATIKNNKFIKNTAYSIGGALQMKGDYTSITSNEFTQNIAKSSGGAIYIEGKIIEISSNDFTSNVAGASSVGGAIRLVGDYAKISSNTFKNNNAKQGLSIYANGNFETLKDNKYPKSDEKKEVVWKNVIVKTQLTDLTKSIVVTIKNKYIKATLKDDKGNPITNQKLTFTFNGKTYNANTNSKGVARVKVNVNTVKSYKMTVKFNKNHPYDAISATSTVTVIKENTKITTPSKTFKNSAKNKKVTITLKSASRKSLAKKKITLKINEKTYKSTTNKKGQVTVNVKITKKGKFIYTAKFAGDKQYNSIIKKGTVTIK